MNNRISFSIIGALIGFLTIFSLMAPLVGIEESLEFFPLFIPGAIVGAIIGWLIGKKKMMRVTHLPQRLKYSITNSNKRRIQPVFCWITKNFLMPVLSPKRNLTKRRKNF